MPDPASHTPTNRELRLHCAAVLYFLSRAAAVVFVFSVPVSYFLRGHVEISLAAGGAALVTVLFTLYYFSAKGLLCTACRNPVLMDNGNRKHVRAKRPPGLSHRAQVAWDILSATNFQCMYCHTRCRCKKRWDGQAGAGAVRPVPLRNGTADVFPDSPFSGVEGLSGELTSLGPLPVEEGSPFGAASPRVAPSPLFPPPGITGGRTAPVPITGPVAHTASVRFAALSSVERAAGAGDAAPGRFPSNPPSPVPWNFPAPAETPAQDNPMNRPSTENPQIPPGANPFLAAALTSPPVPLPASSPGEPPSPFHQEFPFNSATAAASASPAPWTLPSMPVPAYETAPVWPAAPVMTPPAPPAPVIAPAPALSAELLPEGLLQDVIAALEAGQRALTDAFQSILVKLEASVAASRQAPVAAVPSPVEVEPLPLPPAPPALVLPPPMEPPVMFAAPGPVAPARETTTIVELPAMPAPAATMAPAVEPAAPVDSPSATPRRRFARPSGLAAQQLSTALHEVFETAPPVPPRGVADGDQPLPPAPASPFDAVPAMHLMTRVPLPVSPFDTVPAPPLPPRPQVPAPDAVYAPFAAASPPLPAPDGMPGEPVPFTFLKNNGDHFVPDEAAPPGSTYDPLDDTVLPWMQPLATHPARN